jgi:hypothetical protein
MPANPIPEQSQRGRLSELSEEDWLAKPFATLALCTML